MAGGDRDELSEEVVQVWALQFVSYCLPVERRSVHELLSAIKQAPAGEAWENIDTHLQESKLLLRVIMYSLKAVLLIGSVVVDNGTETLGCGPKVNGVAL